MPNVLEMKLHKWWTTLPFKQQTKILQAYDDMHRLGDEAYEAVEHMVLDYGLTKEQAEYALEIFRQKILGLKNPRLKYRHFPGKHLGKDLRVAEEYRKRILDDLEFMEKAVARARAHTGKVPESLKTAIKKMFEKLENVNMIIIQYQAGLKGDKLKKNPPAPAVEIYDTILAIEAQKGNGSLWPKEKFRHDFEKKSNAKVYGLPDGSLLIKSRKRLWKNFDGYKEGIDY